MKKIHHLLYTEGYTIKGVQKLMKGMGKQQLIADEIEKPAANQSAPVEKPQQAAAAPAKTEGLSDKQRVILQAMLGDLKELRDMLRGEENS